MTLCVVVMRQLFVFPPSVHVGAVTCGPPPRQDAAQRHRGNVVVCVEPRADSPTRHNIPLVMNRVIFGTFYSSLYFSRRFLSFFFSTFAAFIHSHRRLSAPENLNITKFFLVFLLLLYFQLVHGDDDNLNARVTRPCDCTVGLAVASSAMRERRRNIYVSLCSSSPISFFSMKFCYLPRCVFSLTPAAPIPGNLQILF